MVNNRVGLMEGAMFRWDRNAEKGGVKYHATTTDFDGLGDLSEFLLRMPDKFHYERSREAARDMVAGSPRQVEEAEKLLRAYETRGILAPLTPIMRTGVVGFAPNVPAVLAGHPETMFRRDTSDAMSERSPMNILIDCGVVANVSSETVEARGIALLVLVMAIQTVRPIKLRLIDTMDWSGSNADKPAGETVDPQTFRVNNRFVMWAVDIPTQPLHLAQVAYCLTNHTMACDMPFAHTQEVLKRRVGGFGFAWGCGPHNNPEEYEKQIRLHWELAPTDLVFIGASLNQGIGSDPMQWVQDQIEKLKANPYA